jgi:hypothetical protein
MDARQHTRKRIKQLDKDTALWTIGDAHGGEIYYTAGQRKDGPHTAPPHGNYIKYSTQVSVCVRACVIQMYSVIR